MRLVVVLFGSLFFAMHTLATEPAVKLQQLKVLQLLASEGVLAAQTELARRAIAQYRQNNTADNALLQLKQQLYASARVGDLNALYHLAHALLIEQHDTVQQRSDGLGLLAAAALLGQTKARLDYRFMPDNTNWSRREYVDAFHVARIAILQANLFPCHRLGSQCDKAKDNQALLTWINDQPPLGPELEELQSLTAINEAFKASVIDYDNFRADRRSKYSQRRQYSNQQKNCANSPSNVQKVVMAIGNDRLITIGNKH